MSHHQRSLKAFLVVVLLAGFSVLVYMAVISVYPLSGYGHHSDPALRNYLEHLKPGRNFQADDMVDFHEGMGRGHLPHSHRKPHPTPHEQPHTERPEGNATTTAIREHSTPVIAIGCAITTQGQNTRNTKNLGQVLPFFRTFLPTFCHTASAAFRYDFYLAYDNVDMFFNRHHALTAFRDAFTEILCPSSLEMSLHFVRCDHTGHPAWAQNDAMLEAYLDDADYYFRVNDDTRLVTKDWTESFIQTLSEMDPPNIGVVGPSHTGGNEHILTHDFVHKTHFEIFGFYYPRTFNDWYADDWMTAVYQPGRSIKLDEVKATHTWELGTRYNHSTVSSSVLYDRLTVDRDTLNRYIRSTHNVSILPSSKKVISMSLYGDEPRYTFGAIRNAQLRPIFFPQWTLRFYTEKVAWNMRTTALPERVRNKLLSLGAEIVDVDSSQVSIPPMMWRFLVADDANLDVFLVRDADSRLSQRDATLVQDWLTTDKPFHCIRDHPSHVSDPVYGGLWGGRSNELRTLVVVPFKLLMKGYSATYGQDLFFLSNAIWTRVKYFAYCHDSASCGKYSNFHPIQLPRHGYEHVGQVFDAHEVGRSADVEILQHSMDSAFCQGVHKGTIDLQTYYRAAVHKYHKSQQGADNSVVRSLSAPSEFSKIVIWTMDYDIEAVNDLKHLLRPLGVNFIDKSMSPKCRTVGTCANNLAVVNPDNAKSASEELVEQFYVKYKDAPEMKNVTHFLCIRPVAICELYIKLNKTVIMWITDRYELERETAVLWRVWNRHFYQLTWNKHNLVAANNHYDVEYVRYFTGLRPEYLPSTCSYIHHTYNRSRTEFLVMPIDQPELRLYFTANLNKILVEENIRIKLRFLSENDSLTSAEIVSYAGIIHIPSKVSSFEMCEHYRLAMPMFFPSLSLLLNWHDQYGALPNRTLNEKRRAQGVTVDGSPIGGVSGKLDPNMDKDPMSLKYWLRFADFYSWPYINLFDSINQLVFLLESSDLYDISNNMNNFNIKLKSEITQKWIDLLRKSL